MILCAPSHAASISHVATQRLIKAHDEIVGISSAQKLMRCNATPHSPRCKLDVLIPKIFFIYLYPVLFQYLPIFFLKTIPTMMLFLLIDVRNQSLAMRETNGKNTKANLPWKTMMLLALFFDPYWWGRLDFFDEIWNCNSARKRNGKMHMIFHTTDSIDITSHITPHFCHVFI